jgi:hypothetical protein
VARARNQPPDPDRPEAIALEDGEIVQRGGWDEFYSAPATTLLRGLARQIRWAAGGVARERGAGG